MEHAREEILVGRAVDGTASADEWTEIEARADADPIVWRRIGHSMRDEAFLRGGLDDAFAVADGVGLPGAAAPRFTRVLDNRFARAAVVLIAITAGFSIGSTSSGVASEAAEPTARFASPAELLRKYVEGGRAEGRVVDELPELLLHHRPASSGEGIEVFYVRRLLERRIVDQSFEIATDEHGRLAVVPGDLGESGPGTSF
ncbi:MAG: hypothetical protein CMJ83_03625 [Planctomycetes bacterium]|nr:hypothetical protein [Planctomycetota bacterium]